MTTIAYDGRYLAADTMASAGNTRLPGRFGKIHICGDVVYAHSGNLAYSQPLIAWHANGARDSAWPVARDNCENVLVVAWSTTVTTYERDIPYAGAVLGPEAWGSGAKVAMGAMAAGMTAQEAVAVAMELDICTGGTVEWVDLRHPARRLEFWNPAQWLAMSPGARRHHRNDWAASTTISMHEMPSYADPNLTSYEYPGGAPRGPVLRKP